MCLTVPRKVEKVEGDKALMQDGRWVKTTMVGRVKKGEMLLVQADMAVEKITKKQSLEMKRLIS